MNQYRAAICEDEEKILHFLELYLRRNFQKDSIEITLDTFTNGPDLLAAISQGISYDILFLDIEMPEMNGIEVCKKIRATNTDVLIIFVSNKEELVFQSFEVRPFRFVRKLHFHEEAPKLIKDIHHELLQKQGTFLTIHEDNSKSVYSINLNKLMYVEAFGKYCNFVTTESELKIRFKLSKCLILLQPYGFLQPHRCYLVNYRYIFCIGDQNITLDNKTLIPISKKRLTELKNQFLILSQRSL